MPDTPETLLIRQQELQQRTRTPQPDHPWPASAFHDPTHTPQVRVPPKRPAPVLDPHAQKPEPPQPAASPSAFVLTARSSLKVVAVLDPAELLTIAVPDQPRLPLTIELPDGSRVTADLNAKSARRAIAAVREAGPDGVSAIIQGRLVNSEITEAGITVQPKAVKAPKQPPPQCASETA